LEHLNRVTKIEVEYLVGVENMHLGESSRLKQVVNGGALCALAARQVHNAGRGLRAAEETTFNGMRFEMQQGLDFAGGHHHRC
jgi:hypothetical protein